MASPLGLTLNYDLDESAPYYIFITVIWLYFALKIFHTLLFRTVLISYAPHIVYETRVKVSLSKKIFVRLIFVRTAAY